MKKLMFIFSCVILAVLLLLFLFIFILMKDDEVLTGNEKVLLERVSKELGITKEQIQIIPDNYTVLGELYGIYYKPDKNNKHIKELWLYGDNVTSLPEEVKQMPMLEKLVISNTSMEYIDSIINQLKGLKVLDLSHNKIRKINNLDNLVHLEELDLSYNKLSKIEKLGNLYSLKGLKLEGNNIKNIENLELVINDLGFFENKLIIMKKNQFISQLKKVNLKDNPFPCNINNKAEIHKLESRGVKIITDCE